ncbi:hypothetical protein ABID77_000345 [Variovorax sp. PvP013]
MPARQVRRAVADEQPHQVGQAGGRQGRVLAHHQIDQRGGPLRAALGTVIHGGRMGHRLVDPRAAVASPHPQQAAVVQAVEEVRTGVARAAPVVRHAAVGEMPLDLARMHRAPLAHEVQDLDRLASRVVVPGPGGFARMHQREVLARQEAVVHQAVLLDREALVAALEIAGAVVLDPVAQRQILRPGGRADRVGLHEAQAPDGRRQRRRLEEGARHRVAAQVVEIGFAWHRKDCSTARPGRRAVPPADALPYDADCASSSSPERCRNSW